MRNNRGSILILCFWALIFLSILGYGITRRVNAELSLARYQAAKAQSKYAAFAGLFYVLDQIQRDLNNEDTQSFDTAYNCGLDLEGAQTPEDFFSGQNVADASFDVVIEDDDTRRFALEDESGKLNINGLHERNYNILTELLTALEVEEDQAKTIASSVIDWKDKNQDVFNEGFGAEQGYYQQLNPAHECKNYNFESIEELLFIRGVTPEIFEKLKSYVTVFPRQGPLHVNYNTAPREVLLALAMSVAGPRTNTDKLDARGFVEKIIEFRQGPDSKLGTVDDEPVEPGKLALFSGPEIAIAAALRPVQSSKASVIRAHIVGSDDQKRTKTFLDAVIETQGLGVVSLSVQ